MLHRVFPAIQHYTVFPCNVEKLAINIKSLGVRGYTHKHADLAIHAFMYFDIFAQANPERRRITVSSTGPVTDKPPLAPPSSSDRGNSGYTVLSKIPTKSSHDPVVRQKSKPGDSGGTATRPQVHVHTCRVGLS